LETNGKLENYGSRKYQRETNFVNHFYIHNHGLATLIVVISVVTK